VYHLSVAVAIADNGQSICSFIQFNNTAEGNQPDFQEKGLLPVHYSADGKETSAANS